LGKIVTAANVVGLEPQMARPFSGSTEIGCRLNRQQDWIEASAGELMQSIAGIFIPLGGDNQHGDAPA